jgi:hypothetical protein
MRQRAIGTEKNIKAGTDGCAKQNAVPKAQPLLIAYRRNIMLLGQLGDEGTRQ